MGYEAKREGEWERWSRNKREMGREGESGKRSCGKLCCDVFSDGGVLFTWGERGPYL